MKKFLRVLLCYLLIMAAVIGLANAAYVFYENNFDEEIGEYNYNVYKFRHMPEAIRICNFGSSHGMRSFLYEDYDEAFGCMNFGMSGQSLSYDLRILKQYQDRLQKGGTAFLVISYHSLYGIEETKREDFDSLNKRYYPILSKELVKEYEPNTAFWLTKMHALAGNDGILSAAIQHFVLKSEMWDTTDESMIPESAEKSYLRLILARVGEDGRRVINQEELSAVYEMIDICRQIGVTPILITTPYLSEFTDLITESDPAFYADFYGAIDEICHNTGATYMDYSRDERFEHNYALFYDADHLNGYGAQKFTAIVMDEILGM